MEEVFDIADRVTIFRDGRWISTLPRSEVTPERAIHDMVGREIEEFFAKRESQRGELLMSVRGLSRENVFADINFDVYRGEILGFAGLVGSRRTDVGMALFGVEPADTGEISLNNKVENISTPEQAMRLGVAYMTEDRRLIGLSMPMSITSNISLPMLRQYLTRFGLVQRSAEDATAEKYREQLTIRTPSIQHPVGMLSGGNQQPEPQENPGGFHAENPRCHGSASSRLNVNWAARWEDLRPAGSSRMHDPLPTMLHDAQILLAHILCAHSHIFPEIYPEKDEKKMILPKRKN